MLVVLIAAATPRDRDDGFRSRQRTKAPPWEQDKGLGGEDDSTSIFNQPTPTKFYPKT